MRVRATTSCSLARSIRCASIAEIGFHSASDLFSTFAAEGPALRVRNLRLQYLAGLGVNKYEQAAIYREILGHRRVPEGLFVGSPERIAALHAAMATR